MDNIYYSEITRFDDFFQSLKKEYRLFSPALKRAEVSPSADYSYKESKEAEPLLFNPYRLTEPLKTFFTPAAEQIAEYFSSGNKAEEIGKTIVFGVKNCDLIGHKIQDFVFLEGQEVDSLYRVRRENTILVSGDCTDYKPVCHCLAWDVFPYPQAGFDLNISPLNEGYVVEAGSKRGAGLIEQHREYFSQAKESQVLARQKKRESLIYRLRVNLLSQNLVPKNTVQDLVRRGYGLDTWRNYMLTCVECGGCNLICDTCHCFLLADKKKGCHNFKLRAWDSCQYPDFTRVAGGARALKTRSERLRNRFMKKFDFFVDNLDMPACCGCGRCIEVCPGKIDIREVLKDLAKKLNNKP
ncbi:MAG: 4Fe-4S dicluster domain-containing protein [Candidatus Omnitrophota bacterium]